MIRDTRNYSGIAQRRRAVVWTSVALLLLVTSAVAALEWHETFRKVFHTSPGAQHRSVAAHGDHAILAGNYAVDVLSFDSSDDSWKLDFRINENATSFDIWGLPVVAADAARVAYARKDPSSRSSWEVRARFHFDEPNEWKSIIKGIPAPVYSIDFSNNTRAVVGYAESHMGPSGARIYEYNGASFQHVATMDPGTPEGFTSWCAAIDGDWAVGCAGIGSEFFLLVYRRVGPGNWQFHEAVPTDDNVTNLAMDGKWLVAGGGSDQPSALVYRRQGRSEQYQLDQVLTSPLAGGSFYFAFDVEVIDDEVYVADSHATLDGYPGSNHGAVHRFVYSDGTWKPSLDLVSSHGKAELLGYYVSATTDHVIATGSDTFYSFDRPGVH